MQIQGIGYFLCVRVCMCVFWVGERVGGFYFGWIISWAPLDGAHHAQEDLLYIWHFASLHICLTVRDSMLKKIKKKKPNLCHRSHGVALIQWD